MRQQYKPQTVAQNLRSIQKLNVLMIDKKPEENQSSQDYFVNQVMNLNKQKPILPKVYMTQKNSNRGNSSQSATHISSFINSPNQNTRILKLISTNQDYSSQNKINHHDQRLPLHKYKYEQNYQTKVQGTVARKELEYFQNKKKDSKLIQNVPNKNYLGTAQKSVQVSPSSQKIKKQINASPKRKFTHTRSLSKMGITQSELKKYKGKISRAAALQILIKKKSIGYKSPNSLFQNKSKTIQIHEENEDENSERDRNNFVEINQCKNIISEFNNTRKESEYQKFHKLISGSKKLQNILSRFNFEKKIIQHDKGLKSTVENSMEDNPVVNKANHQILVLEEAFEKQNSKKFKRPNLKESVLNKLNNGLASNGFLELMRKESNLIDIALKEDQAQNEKHTQRLNQTFISSSMSPQRSRQNNQIDGRKNIINLDLKLNEPLIGDSNVKINDHSPKNNSMLSLYEINEEKYKDQSKIQTTMASFRDLKGQLLIKKQFGNRNAISQSSSIEALNSQSQIQSGIGTSAYGLTNDHQQLQGLQKIRQLNQKRFSYEMSQLSVKKQIKIAKKQEQVFGNTNKKVLEIMGFDQYSNEINEITALQSQQLARQKKSVTIDENLSDTAFSSKIESKFNKNLQNEFSRKFNNSLMSGSNNILDQRSQSVNQESQDILISSYPSRLKNFNDFQPYNDISNILNKKSPFLPPHLQYFLKKKEEIQQDQEKSLTLKQQSSSQVAPQSKLQKNNNLGYNLNQSSIENISVNQQNSLENKKILKTIPNFIEPLFSIKSQVEEHIADPEQVKQINKLFCEYYGMIEFEQLDLKNRALQQINKANQFKKQNQSQSMSTMNSCNQVIVTALMTQECEYVQQKYAQFLKSGQKKVQKDSVFDRIKIDLLYRKERFNFFKFIHANIKNSSADQIVKNLFMKKKQEIKDDDEEPLNSQQIQSQKQNSNIQNPKNYNIEELVPEEININNQDLLNYFKDGGNINELFNKKLFIEILNQYQTKNQYGNQTQESQLFQDTDFLRILVRQSFQRMLKIKIELQKENLKQKYLQKLRNEGMSHINQSLQASIELQNKRRDLKKKDTILENISKNEKLKKFIFKDEFFEEKLSGLKNQIQSYYAFNQYLYDNVLEQQLNLKQ